MLIFILKRLKCVLRSLKSMANNMLLKLLKTEIRGAGILGQRAGLVKTEYNLKKR